MTLLGSQQTTEGSRCPARLQPLPPRLGVMLVHIRDMTRLRPRELWPLSHSYSELKKHLMLVQEQYSQSSCRLCVEGPLHIPTQQRPLPRAWAWTTVPLTSWVASDKAPLPPSLSLPLCVVGIRAVPGLGSGIGHSTYIG